MDSSPVRIPSSLIVYATLLMLKVNWNARSHIPRGRNLHSPVLRTSGLLNLMELYMMPFTEPKLLCLVLIKQTSPQETFVRPYHRRLVAKFFPRKPGFSARAVLVIFVTHKEALR
jgi:hypothetical protein